MTLEETLTSPRPDQHAAARRARRGDRQAGGSASTASSSSRSTRPRTIQEAMEKQMRAERDRRAAILTRRGRQAVADPHRRGREAVGGAAAPRAPRTAAILRAEGEAKAIDTVFAAIHDGDARPGAAQLPVPADAAAARPGRGEQDLRDPERVHDRRSATSAARSAARPRAQTARRRRSRARSRAAATRSTPRAADAEEAAAAARQAAAEAVAPRPTRRRRSAACPGAAAAPPHAPPAP